jgi:tetratricopeptide (TPR) repeat protein
VPEPGAVSISGPLLIASVERAGHPDGATPFQYFGSQFHPSGKRQFRADSPARVLFQVDVPVPAADYELEYVLAHLQVRDARRTVTDTIRAAQFHDGRLLTSRSLSLDGLPEGDYRLIVNARRLDNHDVILASANTGFHIVPAPAESVLYFDPNTRKMAQPGMAAYIRALAALVQKDESRAITYLRQSVDLNPANVYADAQAVELYYRLKQFSEITRLYDKLGITPFENSAESLAQISLSLWNVGQQDRARDVLKSAQASFPGNPLVGALAKTVR